MDIESNRRVWDREFDWAAEQGGEDWSRQWGNSETQWHWTLLPRVHRFLPAATILEIGPGHGRWTVFLKPLCSRLILVDLSASCIEACRRRFGPDPAVEYHVTDGASLDMVADGSVDFIFSFDSLVHADTGVMTAYAAQFARKLAPGGHAFVHHSNLGAYRYLTWIWMLNRRPFQSLYGRLAPRIIDEAWRDRGMTAARFRAAAEAAGLPCPVQELVNWRRQRWMIDCFSTLGPKNGPSVATALLENQDFMREAAYALRVGGTYR